MCGTFANFSEGNFVTVLTLLENKYEKFQKEINKSLVKKGSTLNQSETQSHHIGSINVGQCLYDQHK